MMLGITIIVILIWIALTTGMVLILKRCIKTLRFIKEVLNKSNLQTHPLTSHFNNNIQSISLDKIRYEMSELFKVLPL